MVVVVQYVRLEAYNSEQSYYPMALPAICLQTFAQSNNEPFPVAPSPNHHLPTDHLIMVANGVWE